VIVNRRNFPIGNLPSQPTRFIGHTDEVMRLAAVLEASPVLTVIGSGGIGKTRTAIELARHVAPSFPDGVWFVNLALLDDGADVVPFVCETLRDIAPLARDTRTFASSVSDKRVLLLFDSCEHVITQTGDLLDAIAAQAPDVRLLVTSRQPLGIAAETAHRLGALPTQDGIELFYDRARNAGVVLVPERRPIVAAIVKRLDSIPLAIELAAPQLRTMPPEELLKHVDDRLQLLGMQNRGAPSRQQTLEAMLEWSHRLLDARAQQLFRRLAIFVGGCTLEAAMHVCADPEFNEARVSEALDDLVAKSLVVPESAGGRTRYRMLEITRAYAQGRLFDSQEYDEAAHAHVHYFVILAKRFEAVLDAVPVLEWQNTVMLDAQNFRAALSLALDAGDVESAAAICESLHYWLWEHGAVHASDLTRRIATMLSTTLTPQSEAPLRLAYASLLRRTDRQRALESAKRAYDIYRGIGDTVHLCDALRGTGSLQHDVLGAPSSALSGDMERYTSVMLDCGSTLRAAELLNNLGVSYAQMLDDERLQDARVCFERAAGLLEARGDQERAGRVIGNSAAVAYLLGDCELAIRWCRRAVALFNRQVETVGAGHQWSNLGFYLSVVGRYDEAREALRRGISIARNLGDRVGLSSAMDYAAHYSHAIGQDTRAARFIGCAEALQPSDVMRQARGAAVMNELVETLRDNLGEERFDRERKLGAVTPVDELAREIEAV
jgi:non-specific serine/threonine protein kinase